MTTNQIDLKKYAQRRGEKTSIKPICSQSGLSLIELMVAMTIGLLMLSVISRVYTSSKTGFIYANNTVRMGEDATFAIDALSRDIRMAAYGGCVGAIQYMSPGPDNLPNTADDVEDTLMSTPKLDKVKGITLTSEQKPNVFSSLIFTANNAVQGFPGGAGAAALAARTALGTSTSYTVSTATPILYIAGGAAQAAQVKASVAAAATTVSFGSDPYNWANNFDNSKKPFMLIADCKGAEMFRAKSMSAAYALSTEAALINAYGQDAVVMPLVTSTYFLATRTGANTPSLYRRFFNGSTAAVEELVPNMASITFHYGLNTSNDASGNPTYRADNYIKDSDTAFSTMNWSRVVSIRIGLIMASEDSNQTVKTSQTVNWIDGTYTPASSAEKRLHRSYSTTVSIRNRMGL